MILDRCAALTPKRTRSKVVSVLDEHREVSRRELTVHAARRSTELEGSQSTDAPPTKITTPEAPSALPRCSAAFAARHIGR